jgi:hypothetical protein
MYTLKFISTITDDSIRKQAFDMFNDRISAINSSSGSVDEKNQQIADFCVGEMQGHITAFYDQFLGITHRLRLGTV